MSRLRRFENLEKTRPAGSERPAAAPGVSDRFGSPGQGAPSTAEPPSRALGRPERFEPAPVEGAALRLREPDEGQPFVRCARCRADGHASAVACSNCGADLTTREQRAYNEGVWRRQQAERAEQQEQVARLEAARAQAEREAARAHRELDELIRRTRSRRGRLSGGQPDALREAARGLRAALGAWLRRALPERTHRIAVVLLAALVLAGLVAAFPLQAWRGFAAVLLIAAAYGWYRRALRLGRE